MLKKLLILSMFFLYFIHIFGCGSKVVKTKLDQLFEKNFEGLEVPEANEIKNDDVKEGFPYTTFDKVWDSSIIVLMQRGIIVRASRESGTILTITSPPLAIFVEKGDVITVYLKRMYNLYEREHSMVENIQIARTFFDKLATQVYAGQKWKYLYGESPK